MAARLCLAATFPFLQLIRAHRLRRPRRVKALKTLLNASGSSKESANDENGSERRRLGTRTVGC
jgi:hypothetical protein